MQKADPLIRTKLRLPPARPGLVLRPRLQQRVIAGLGGRLTLITAPAGFGKTTLAAASIAACGMPAAWLSLDKDDNQPGRFLSYLIAALQGVDARLGREAAVLNAGVRPAQPEATLTSLINDLDAAGTQIVLALDDYQFIGSPAAHRQAAFLLEHAPETLHVLIATRSDPPLPLARWRARGWTVELRAADLRFSEPEAARFLSDVMGLQLEAGPVAALAERTEGWIAGLQMAGLALQSSPASGGREDVAGFIAAFSGTQRYIMDYLLEEALAGQPPEIQHFLLSTSILDRLSAALCAALLDEDEGPSLEMMAAHPSAALLERLERLNLFLTPLDDERTWFRYHHLFADLLRLRLQQAQPERVARLHLRAAGWLERSGFISEAVHHLAAAGEIGRAADLIERYGPERLAQGDPSVLRLADDLPAEMLTARPKTGLYHAWFLIIQGRIAEALPLLKDLQAQPGGAESGRQWMQAVIASALAFLAPPDHPAEAFALPPAEALEAIPADEPILRNTADFLYGMALARSGDLERVVEAAQKSIRREQSGPGKPAIPTLAPLLSRVYLMQGRLHAAAGLCREYLDPINASAIRFIYTAGSMKIDLGEVLTEWNRLDEAEEHIRGGLQANRTWKNIMTDGFGLVALQRVLLAKGNHAGALQAVETLERRLTENARPREFEEEFRTLRARLQLAGGDLQGAADWADEVQRSPDYELHPERYRLTLARLRLAQGRFAEVENLLAGWTPPDAAGSRVTRRVETGLILAAAQAGQGRLPQALERIEACLALAEPEGCVRAFMDPGEAARELLSAYLRSGAGLHKAFARKILGAFSQPQAGGARAPTAAGPVEALTGRELEVLRLMALGLTNRAIAARLVVSTGTVKAHTAAIYRKLDAANRTEAAQRARELGLLS